MDRTATQKLELAIFLYISYGFRTQCNVKVHFQHDFKICGALSRFIYEQLMSLVIHLFYSFSLFIVCQTMFTLCESRSISQTIERERQAQDQRFIQQVAGNPRWGRFTIETVL